MWNKKLYVSLNELVPFIGLLYVRVTYEATNIELESLCYSIWGIRIFPET